MSAAPSTLDATRIDLLLRPIHIAANIYHHGRQNQNRLLAECLRTVLATMEDRGIPVRFWFNRSDIRGPHIFALLTVPEAFAEEVRILLSLALDDYLAKHSSTGIFSLEQVEAFHEACRGRELCELDRLPGIAATDSYRIFEQPGDRYPFRLSRHLPNSEELWEILAHRVWEVLEEVSPQRTSTGAAIRWVAGVDLELQRLLGGSSEYWLYHASTLYFGIERLQQEESFLEILIRLVGTKNQKALSRIWSAAEVDSRPIELGRLVEIAITHIPSSRRWALLREIDHFTLKQLGVPVNLHLPIILFALHRNLSQRSDGHAGEPE